MKRSIIWCTLLCVMALGLGSCGYRSVRFEAMEDGSHSAHISTVCKYLLLPIEDEAPEVTVEVISEQYPVQSILVRAARGKVDYYMPLALDKFDTPSIEVIYRGEPTTLFVESISLGNKFEYDYNEPFRPLYHHTAPYGWMNDPNGMIYSGGVYHLYYQHNPYGSAWGNMTWGHSVSKDLIHWEDMGDAIFPDENGTVFSGCCVIDERNDTGLGADTQLAFYTANAPDRQTQCLAYSHDGGRTYKKYEGNPILTSDTERDFRDPKVFWHAPTQKWVMALGAGKKINFYSSDNMLQWDFESSFNDGGRPDNAFVWECPDLFLLNVDGSEKSRWVLVVSVLAPGGSESYVRYWIGSFDGHKFTPDDCEPRYRLMDYGTDFYAPSTWENEPKGRRVMIGWLNGVGYGAKQPTTYYRGMHTVPREIQLKEGKNGEVVLTAYPCAELNSLQNIEASFRNIVVEDSHNFRNLCKDNEGAIVVDLNAVNEADYYTVTLFNEVGESVELLFDCINSSLTVNRGKSGKVDLNEKFIHQWTLPLRTSKTLELSMFLDRSSIECFVNGGEEVVSFQIYPSQPYNSVTICSHGGTTTVNRLEVYKITK